jgi:hypothetical protein
MGMKTCVRPLSIQSGSEKFNAGGFMAIKKLTVSKNLAFQKENAEI